MASLASSARLSEELYESPTRHAFMGKILPPEEGRFDQNYGLVDLLLRVRPDCPIGTGDEMIDPMGRRYLLLDFDTNPISRSHRLVLLNELMTWARLTSIIDPVTKAEKDDVRQVFDPVWVSIQTARSETSDSVINIKQDLRRVVTRVNLQPGDFLGKYRVERSYRALGVTIAEVQ